MKSQWKNCLALFVMLTVLSTSVIAIVKGAWDISDDWTISPDWTIESSDSYTLTLTINQPTNTTYSSFSVPVQLSTSGNDTNPVVTYNFMFSNGTWFYGTNQTYTVLTNILFSGNATGRLCTKAVGDHEVSDYKETYFTVLVFVGYSLSVAITNPENATYTTSEIPVQLSSSGNDTNQVITYNFKYPNSTWLYPINQTYSTPTYMSILDDVVSGTFCALATGDHTTAYQEIQLSVNLTNYVYLTIDIKPGAGGGTISPIAGVHAYPIWTEVTLVATEDEHSTFLSWEVDGVNYTSSSTYVLNMQEDNHTATAYFLLSSVTEGSGEIMTLYFRSDTYTTLGVTANGLDSSYTNGYDYSSITSTGSATIRYGFRAWLITSDTEATELTNGSPSGIITLSTNTTGYSTSTCDFYGSTVTLGYQALKVIIYTQNNTDIWIVSNTFVSNVLITEYLQPAIWQFTLYTNYVNNGSYTVSTYYFDTYNYKSKLANIIYTKPSDSTVNFWRISSGDLIGFIIGSYYDILGPAFYVLILFGFCASLYRRYGHFGTVAFWFVLFAGPGSLLMIFLPAWAIIPTAILLIVGCTFLVWRLIR